MQEFSDRMHRVVPSYSTGLRTRMEPPLQSIRGVLEGSFGQLGPLVPPERAEEVDADAFEVLEGLLGTEGAAEITSARGPSRAVSEER